MATQKTKPTPASVDDFVKAIADPKRREDCLTLIALMKKATKCEPKMWGSSTSGSATTIIDTRAAQGRHLHPWLLPAQGRPHALHGPLHRPVFGEPRPARQAQDRQGMPVYPQPGGHRSVRPGHAPQEGRDQSPQFGRMMVTMNSADTSLIRAGYDRWALVYDHDANPLPALEEPFVAMRSVPSPGWPCWTSAAARAAMRSGWPPPVPGSRP